MLYVTTRSATDTYTSHRALTSDVAPDGGCFVPFKMPAFSPQDIKNLKDKPYNQIIADVLNMFFSTGITMWDVDFVIGKQPAKLFSMNHRIIVAELWHNLGDSFDYVVEQLYKKLLMDHEKMTQIGDWAQTAIRIAVLFAVYGQLTQEGRLENGAELDVAVSAKGFMMPMVCRYAKEIGLPVKTVICACDDSSNVWDLIHRGTFSASGVAKSLKLGVEKLVHAALGVTDACAFSDTCSNEKIFTVNADSQTALSEGFFCAVVGSGRAASSINSVYRSNGYIADPQTACCFGALQDYRSGQAGSRTTLFLAERTPLDFLIEITGATGISYEELTKNINR